MGDDGKPARIVKFATDITAEKLRRANDEGKINAIDRAQAVVEFSLDGRVLGESEFSADFRLQHRTDNGAASSSFLHAGRSAFCRISEFLGTPRAW
jgi:hypothetical protein